MSVYQLVVAGMSFSLLIAFSLVLFYLRYKRQLTQQLLEMSKAETLHQKELLHAVIQSQEEERKRIGMNLHDEVGTALSSLRLVIERYTTITAKDTGLLQQSKTIIDRAISDVRNISHDLSPIRKGAYDFIDALEDLCNAVNQSGRVAVVLNTDEASEDIQLIDEHALALYRVISELMNNTIKHANAKSININFVTAAGHLHIHYTDDGVGLPDNSVIKKGIGMQNIESRLNVIGGEYTIADPSLGGFRMQIKLPCNT